jgi:hypothetical protein
MERTEAGSGRGMASGETDASLLEPVRRSLRVRATPERAFKVFAEEMDTWWPRTDHIGNSPMKAIVVEGRPGGAIYTVQEDGANCPWASVIAREPPHKFVFAWQVTPDWRYEPDVNKCSEVDVLFTRTDDETTLVEFEHRNLERHGEGWQTMRVAVGSDGGWNGIMAIYVAKAEEAV